MKVRRAKPIKARKGEKVVLLSGGNPQIAKADGDARFLALHTFTRYVKVAFFRGSSLRPVPPGPSEDKDTSFESVAREAKEIEGIRVFVATPEALYRLKKETVRPIDRQDAEALRRAFDLPES